MSFTSIEQALVEFLRSQSSVSSLVGQAIYPGAALSKTLPYIVVSTDDIERQNVLSGPIHPASAVIEVRIYSKSYLDRLNTGEAIRQLLHRFSGTLSGVEIVYSTVRHDKDATINPTDGSAGFVYKRTLELNIGFKEQPLT